MQKIGHEYIFSTELTKSTDINEFIIEFYCENESEESPVKVTRNFDELLDFFEELDLN
ncbi:hypothetical protein HPT25_19800 [Bacillus sp. BRMEA1]|uniref:hypothetical protein n=1 Tax=Neobacillus endophyticus TaxID=2738405 RepID=UPI0015675774|nr:hypothetical protein [Neobacillus endophyticus]NRD79609.1 hypothetical protein [Neobacillus endophyticus]